MNCVNACVAYNLLHLNDVKTQKKTLVNLAYQKVEVGEGGGETNVVAFVNLAFKLEGCTHTRTEIN